jgi:hypothetical protein
MARLSQSQLSGFRIGTSPSAQPELPIDAPRRSDEAAPIIAPTAPKLADQSPPAITAGSETPSAQGRLGPVPAAPTRAEPRHKVGLTLPLELAERVRALTGQGYALADIVMVAYQDQRDQLLNEQEVTTPRCLVRHQRGRSPLTIAFSSAERAALDALAEHLGWTRSHTVTALLNRQFRSGPAQ